MKEQNMHSYDEIKFLPLPTVAVANHPSPTTGGYSKDGRLKVSAVSPGDDGETYKSLNALLASGWELIRFVSHTSSEHDATGVAAIVGRPRKVHFHRKAQKEYWGAHRKENE